MDDETESSTASSSGERLVHHNPKMFGKVAVAPGRSSLRHRQPWQAGHRSPRLRRLCAVIAEQAAIEPLIFKHGPCYETRGLVRNQ
ncbi:MAG TPA: hypothetical protein DDY91_08955 [Planctomycetaceae bacterium]|nr:hypothetical protein [Planctomycetaceae bacterium]